MNQKIESTLKFYKLCNKLKDTIRKGHLIWNVKRKRIESVAEHIYGVQMLALSIYYQFGYKLNIEKVIYMLAIHELEEIKIGDLAFFEIDDQEKLLEGKKATNYILKDILGKEEISKILDEINERKTEEAIFAYHCDKLEFDMQMKLYDQENCCDINHQENNPVINNKEVIRCLENANKVSDVCIEFDREKYQDDENFIQIIDYLKENDI